MYFVNELSMYNFLIYFKFVLNNNLTSDINNLNHILIQLYKHFLLFSFQIDNFTTFLILLICIQFLSLIGKGLFHQFKQTTTNSSTIIIQESPVLQIDFLQEVLVNHPYILKGEYVFVKYKQFLFLQYLVINQKRKKSQNQQTFDEFKSLITSLQRRLIDSFRETEIATNALQEKSYMK
ncbi:unnamed protein product [Paramecium pentaurelia]|uniref:Transmembrane protein n=1 Tax=Paramecium pentaurelia TaxID=43138 RepID=A0A8S1YBX5_9CILI|nr:unnamed protein product [Paramecium pentaurelia]